MSSHYYYYYGQINTNTAGATVAIVDVIQGRKYQNGRVSMIAQPQQAKLAVMPQEEMRVCGPAAAGGRLLHPNSIRHSFPYPANST